MKNKLVSTLAILLVAVTGCGGSTVSSSVGSSSQAPTSSSVTSKIEATSSSTTVSSSIISSSEVSSTSTSTSTSSSSVAPVEDSLLTKAEDFVLRTSRFKDLEMKTLTQVMEIRTMPYQALYFGYYDQLEEQGINPKSFDYTNREECVINSYSNNVYVKEGTKKYRKHDVEEYDVLETFTYQMYQDAEGNIWTGNNSSLPENRSAGMMLDAATLASMNYDFWDVTGGGSGLNYAMKLCFEVGMKTERLKVTRLDIAEDKSFEFEFQFSTPRKFSSIFQFKKGDFYDVDCDTVAKYLFKGDSDGHVTYQHEEFYVQLFQSPYDGTNIKEFDVHAYESELISEAEVGSNGEYTGEYITSEYLQTLA